MKAKPASDRAAGHNLIRHPLPGRPREWQVIDRASGAVLSTHRDYASAFNASRNEGAQ